MRYTERQEEEWAAFSVKLSNTTDEELGEMCEKFIWLSAYASNNPRSNFHRMCDACCDEAYKRGKPEIYDNAHKDVRKSLS